MSIIRSVTARLFAAPLDGVLVDAKHRDHSHFHLITATVTLEDGRSGTGYTYNGGRGGHAIAAKIRHGRAPFPLGSEPDEVEALKEAMDWHMQYAGRGGTFSFAPSGVDIALWDLRCAALGQPLWQVAGSAGRSCKAYGGGIRTSYGSKSRSSPTTIPDMHGLPRPEAWLSRWRKTCTRSTNSRWH